MKPQAFDPVKDIPSLAEKVFLVTGGEVKLAAPESRHRYFIVLSTNRCVDAGTSGLGKEAILALSRKQPAHIYFTGRNSKAASEVIAEVKDANPTVDLTFLECDHTTLASVESAIKRFLHNSERLDALLCNAGVMGLDPGLTKDGYEIQFGINQMAHALDVH